MLIRALCDYYGILEKEGKVVPEGYSRVEISYLISLTGEGDMDGIIDIRNTEIVPAGKGKTKERKTPREYLLFQRSEKTAIKANIVEHRPVYIFGLMWDKDHFTANDRTNKAQKSHKDFVEANLTFIGDLDSPIVNAYRKFLQKWEPARETENPWLMNLGKDYNAAGYAFCLSGNPGILLQDDLAMRVLWMEEYCAQSEKQGHIAQCAITGMKAPIARIHRKIKDVCGGCGTGSVLIGYNNNSEKSYDNDQSYNSNISEAAMQKYTEALNYLLSDSRHRAEIGDMTVVFWAMNQKDTYEDLFAQMVFGRGDQMTAGQTEDMLKQLLKDGAHAGILESQLQSLGIIQTDVDFYMVGLKPNVSRLSVKFMVRRKYADILWNIVRFQQDLQISRKPRIVWLSEMGEELVSPKSSNEKVNPAMIAKVVEAMIEGLPCPTSLLETVVRRVRIDQGTEKINRVRAGIIKACITRSSQKEELTVALDRTNYDQAYLCGRLFATLEKLQQEASENKLNRTIRDTYFASASVKPAAIFPKLIRLAQNHMKKVKRPVFFDKLVQEIVGELNQSFPERLTLKEQGNFIVGYYQQYQAFFEKTNKPSETEEN